MAIYVILESETRDTEGHAEYLKQVAPIVEAHSGRYLARGGAITRIAGGWSPERLTLIEFPDQAAMNHCFSSAQYQALGEIRKSATQSRVIAIDGCLADPTQIETINSVVMLTDVHSFSVVGNEMGSRFPAFVQSYFLSMGDEITRNHGRIVKYLGDSLLAIFPENREEDAVFSALQMRRAYADVVATYRVATETELEVGISAGTLAAGLFGHPSLVSWDIMGEAINEAGRLMHHRGVAVTNAVRRALGDRFAFCRLPDITVKWSEEPLESWEVVER